MSARTPEPHTESPADSRRCFGMARSICRPARCSGVRGTGCRFDRGRRRQRVARSFRPGPSCRGPGPPGLQAAAGDRSAGPRGTPAAAAGTAAAGTAAAGPAAPGGIRAVVVDTPDTGPAARAAAAPRSCCKRRPSTGLPRWLWLHEAQSFACRPSPRADRNARRCSRSNSVQRSSPRVLCSAHRPTSAAWLCACYAGRVVFGVARVRR